MLRCRERGGARSTGEEVAGVWDWCGSGWVTAAQGGSVWSQQRGWLMHGQRGHGLLPQVGHQGRCRVPVVHQQCKNSGFVDTMSGVWLV